MNTENLTKLVSKNVFTDQVNYLHIVYAQTIIYIPITCIHCNR